MVIVKPPEQKFSEFKDPSFKYGLTIRLNKQNIDWNKAITTHSKQSFESYEPKKLINSINKPIVKNNISKPKKNIDKLKALSQYYADEGYLIHSTKDNEIITIKRSLASESFRERNLIIVDKKAIITDIIKSDKCIIHSSHTDIIVNSGAHLDIAVIQALKKNSVSLISLNIILSDNASASILLGSFGSANSLTEQEIHLRGTSSNAYPAGAYLLRGNQQSNHNINVFHTGKNTCSDMLVKGVVTDSSKGLFQGLIDIDNGAFGCEGYQKHESLIIGDKAGAYAIPNLKIRNNDVSCSHGATIGQVDDEQLFYLTSRGISEKNAKKMIIKGFFEPVCEHIKWPELFSVISSFINERLGEDHV